MDSTKLAEKLNKELEKLIPSVLSSDFKQAVLVQVYSGDEDSKFGVDKDSLQELVTFIMKECPRLQFQGLMTMGKLHDVEGFKVRGT